MFQGLRGGWFRSPDGSACDGRLRFEGEVIISPGAWRELRRAGLDLDDLMRRHESGDTEGPLEIIGTSCERTEEEHAVRTTFTLPKTGATVVFSTLWAQGEEGGGVGANTLVYLPDE